MIDELLERFGRERFGDRFVRGIVPDNQPFTIIEYIGPDGEIWHGEHSFFKEIPRDNYGTAIGFG